MHILPKKQDIDKQKANERKIQIDEGVALAKKIDMLREASLQEEKQLFEWRENNINKVKAEIEDYIIVRDNLKTQTEEAERHRKALLEPLDEEWVEINKVKDQLEKEKETVYLSGEQLKENEKYLEKERQKVSEIVSRVTQNEKESEKHKKEAVSLRELAQKEYEVAASERGIQNSTIERKISELSQKEREYEVALTTIQIRENEVNEKESDIIKRELHLESQQRLLRIAKEELK